MTDLHVHTFFCDGRDSPEDMVLSAVSKGVKRLGAVVHSYVPFDVMSCVPLEKVEDFVYEISLLKKKYRDEIELYCGIEADLYSQQDLSPFDYSIGSVHYLKQGEKYIAIDDTPEILKDMIDEYYGGDSVACAADYFKTVSLLAEKKPDIIGHFDLIKKFSSLIPIDEDDPKYRAAWMEAADTLLKLKVPFEVNTGGISRGWTSEPYPSKEIAQYILSHGGRLILSSDAHRKEDIAYGFDRFADMTAG